MHTWTAMAMTLSMVCDLMKTNENASEVGEEVNVDKLSHLSSEEQRKRVN
jgi:hypothetical protein